MAPQEITRLQAIAQRALDGITMGGVDFARQSLVKIVEGLKAAAPHPPAQQAELASMREALLKCKTCNLPTEVRELVNEALRGAPHKAEGAEQ